jgi:hypothetical protein
VIDAVESIDFVDAINWVNLARLKLGESSVAGEGQSEIENRNGNAKSL